MSADWREIITELRAQNWRPEMTARGHWKAFAPDASKGLVTFAESADTHAVKNDGVH